MELTNALYNSLWHTTYCKCLNANNQPLNHHLNWRRSIFILMEYTKRPVTIMAGQFVQLNYETFISVNSTMSRIYISFSYIFLQTNLSIQEIVYSGIEA